MRAPSVPATQCGGHGRQQVLRELFAQGGFHPAVGSGGWLASDAPPNEFLASVMPVVGAGWQSGKFLYVDTDLKIDLPEARVVLDREQIADLGLDGTIAPPGPITFDVPTIDSPIAAATGWGPSCWRSAADTARSRAADRGQSPATASVTPTSGICGLAIALIRSIAAWCSMATDGIFA